MTYIRKTQDEYEIQQYYSGYGWECITTEMNRKAAVMQRKCYRDNQPEIPVRIKMKRVPCVTVICSRCSKTLVPEEANDEENTLTHCFACHKEVSQ